MKLAEMFKPRTAATEHREKIQAAESELRALAADHHKLSDQATAAVTDAASYSKIGPRIRELNRKIEAAKADLANLCGRLPGIEEQERASFAAEVDALLLAHNNAQAEALAPILKAREEEESRHKQALADVEATAGRIKQSFKGLRIALEEVRGGRSPAVAEELAAVTVAIDAVSAEYPRTIGDDLIRAARELREVEEEHGAGDRRKAASKRLAELQSLETEKGERLSLLHAKLKVLRGQS